jgi:adenine/guanine phosphoribosyltransferase-like PRPP-binding protein
MMSYNDYENLAEVVERIVQELRVRRKEFDSIAVRGVSGLIVGGPVSIALNLPLIVIRKPGEESHSSGHTITNKKKPVEKVLFLDDFQATGDTERAVAEGLKSITPGHLVLCYFYLRPGADSWRKPLPARD